MEEKKSPPFYASVIVINLQGEVLLGKRKEDGIWTPPGGSGEDGETPEKAAARELFEEAGLTVDPRFLQPLPTIPTRNGKLCHPFLYTMVIPQVPTSKMDPDEEVGKWNWYTMDKVPSALKESEGRFTSVRNAFRQFYANQSGIVLKSLTEVLEKGRALPIGTVRNWSGKDYIKTSDGWVPQEHGSKESQDEPVKTEKTSAPAEEPKTNQKPDATLKSKNKNIEYDEDLTPEETSALEEYQAGMYNSRVGGYTVVQSVLRDGKSSYGSTTTEQVEEAKQIASQVSSAIGKSRLTSDVTVYRGIKDKGSLKDVKPGQIISDKGFTSTSTDKNVAKKFSEKLNNRDVPTVFEINLKRGQNALYMNDFSQHSTEKEVLLDKGANFKVESVSERQGVRKIVLSMMDIDPNMMKADIMMNDENELEKGGEGSGKKGHTTLHPDDHKMKVAKLTDKLADENPFKTHLQKLEQGAILEGAKLRSGKPVYLNMDSATAHGYTGEEHTEAGNIHYTKAQQLSSQLEKIKAAGIKPKPEMQKIVDFHNKQFKAHFRMAETIERRQKDTDHAKKERAKQVKKSEPIVKSGESAWLEHIHTAMTGYQPGEDPRVLNLENCWDLHLVQVENDLFTGVLKKTVNSPEGSPIVTDKVRVERMTIPSMVQFLIAKGYIQPVAPVDPVTAQGNGYAAMIDHYGGALEDQDLNDKTIEAVLAKLEGGPEEKDSTKSDQAIKILELLTKLIS